MGKRRLIINLSRLYEKKNNGGYKIISLAVVFVSVSSLLSLLLREERRRQDLKREQKGHLINCD